MRARMQRELGRSPCPAVGGDAPAGGRIETAEPAPLIDVDRHAGALADVTDLDVAVIDEPALAVRVAIGTADEL